LQAFFVVIAEMMIRTFPLLKGGGEAGGFERCFLEK
jgi:hypothetical protein